MVKAAARCDAFTNRGSLAFIGGALIGGALSRIEGENRRRDTELALKSLDEAELKDMGVRRNEIPVVAARNFGELREEPAARPGFFRSLYRSWTRRAAIRELEALSDHILYDIGVDRGDIPMVVDAAMSARESSPPAFGKAAPVTVLAVPGKIAAGAPLKTPKKAA